MTASGPDEPAAAPTSSTDTTTIGRSVISRRHGDPHALSRPVAERLRDDQREQRTRREPRGQAEQDAGGEGLDHAAPDPRSPSTAAAVR